MLKELKPHPLLPYKKKKKKKKKKEQNNTMQDIKQIVS